LEVLI